MERIVYIQADPHGQPYSAHGAVAAKGFALLGYTVQFFQRSSLDVLRLRPETPVIGGIGTVRAALIRLGQTPPPHASAPEILAPFLGRKCWRSSLDEIRHAGCYPVFVKPYEEAKLFNGLLLADEAALERLLVPRPGFPPVTATLAVLAQEPVRLLSEWRIFVIRGAVVGSSFYQGDPLLFPDGKVIRQAIAAYVSAPAGYSADFGVTDQGKTLLIETNDGYSLGHGGLTSTLYAELLLARWEEMTATDQAA